ncbi:MAG TPA: amidase [Rhizomicrobium sp.]|nr:amidase [Rhizomicrobium sp.]
MFKEYQKYDAVGLAELVARREVSASELLDTAMARAEEVNPAINAIVRPLEKEARNAIDAGLPSGPLSGVPFLLKDISAHMKGVPTSSGARILANFTPDADSALVTAYRNAGLVIFGKTNTPELGLAATTEPVLFGPSRNPWNLERTTGGSSGGAAAAVAAGIVPAAHASDGGGSIRTPASCCGLFGMKPSRGRVSLAPFAGEGWGGLSQQHAVTRSVRDSAVLLDIASQPQLGDPYWAPPPERPFAQEVGRDPGKLRIGFTTAALTWGTLQAPCVAGVRNTAALCESLGHHVEEVIFPGNFQMMAAAVNVVVSASVAYTLDNEADRRGSPIRPEEVETLTWSIYQESKRGTAVAYATALQTIHAFGRTLSSLFSRFDVLLLSTNGKPPVALGSMNTNAADLTDYGEKLYTFMPNTQPFNVGGQPAMTMPLAWSDEGLPVGVQFAARNGDEATLFRLAAQIEAAAPWADRRPPEEPLKSRPGR